MTVHRHISRNINNISKSRSRTVNIMRQVDGVSYISRIKILVPVLWCLFGGSFGVLGGNVEGVDDSILFKMRWKDPLPSLDPLPPEFQNHDMIRMMSSDKEPYICFVPRHLEVKASEATTRGYDGPTPLELLEPLLINRVCRYKLDHYWTYQLCHGKSLRQYHEDTTSTKVHIVEFYLGKYDLDMMNTDNEKYKAEFAERLKSPTLTPVPTVKLDGIDYPYFAVNMSYGTLCDINQRPRTTQVWYVCDQMSDHDVHSFEEPASCTYRVIVRTPYLCKHPDYRVEVAPENEISCHPEITPSGRKHEAAAGEAAESGDATERLTNLSDEGKEGCSSAGEGAVGTGQNLATSSSDGQGSCRAKPTAFRGNLGRGEGTPQGNEPQRLREMVRENEEFRESALHESEGGSLEDDVKRTLKVFFLPHEEEARPETPPPHDQRHVDRFLNGDYCLQGGTGWWKYEFCYGKRVSQFHMEKGERTQEILLGVWDQQKHRSWVDANPLRKAAAGSNSVIHFYTGGDTCEVTERPRTVKVKLICKSIKNHPDAVSIFLQEPKPCEYALTVESSIVCHVIDSIDEYGLPADETPVDSHYKERATTLKPSQVQRVTYKAIGAQSRRDEDAEGDAVEEIIGDETSRDRSRAAARKEDKREATDEKDRVTTPAQKRGRKSPSGV